MGREGVIQQLLMIPAGLDSLQQIGRYFIFAVDGFSVLWEIDKNGGFAEDLFVVVFFIKR